MNRPTCIVMGNGPSLAKVPRAFLDRFPTFGVNGIGLLFSPTHWVCVDPKAFSICKPPAGSEWWTPFLPNGHGLVATEESRFFDIPPKAYQGWSSVVAALQVAWWLGFRRALLLGMDHRYIGPQDVWYGQEGPDLNHFDPRYIPQGTQVKHGEDGSFRAECDFRLMGKGWEERGGVIINMTSGTQLEAFPTLPLELVL